MTYLIKLIFRLITPMQTSLIINEKWNCLETIFITLNLIMQLSISQYSLIDHQLHHHHHHQNTRKKKSSLYDEKPPLLLKVLQLYSSNFFTLFYFKKFSTSVCMCRVRFCYKLHICAVKI